MCLREQSTDGCFLMLCFFFIFRGACDCGVAKSIYNYTTIFASDSDINNVHATVNREPVGVDNWLKANRLAVNVSKTSYMIISNQKKWN